VATPTAPTSDSAPIAGCLRCDSRIQNPASPSSIAMPTTIAAIPHPVGRTKTARKMARIRAIYVLTIRTGVPIFTWSKSQVASGMSIRMQPCEAE